MDYFGTGKGYKVTYDSLGGFHLIMAKGKYCLQRTLASHQNECLITYDPISFEFEKLRYRFDSIRL